MSGNLTNPTNDFTATIVVEETVGITSNSVLGNSANTVRIDGGTLQFNGPGIVVPRQIVLTTFGGTFNTAGNQAQVSGAISGSGDVTKQGAGTLVLSGANTFTGDLDIYRGSVFVTGSVAAETTGVLGCPRRIRAHTLGGTGTLNRTITASAGRSPRPAYCQRQTDRWQPRR